MLNKGIYKTREERPKAPFSIILEPFSRFFRIEASSAILLLVCTLAAVFWANSPWSSTYFELQNTDISLQFGPYSLSQPLLLWINDGLMAIFFFVVGLEIKREVLVGALSKPGQAVLPIGAAVGGMLLPAGLFWLFNAEAESVHGWAIPMATDIAFALGVLTLLGDRVPVWIKVFLTATAIADDIGAILVIAIFYSHGFSVSWLMAGLAVWLLMYVANKLGIRHPLVYGLVGVVMWIAFLKSGIHSTIAGVCAAMAIPARSQIRPAEFLPNGRNLLQRFEEASSPEISGILGNREQYAALVGLKLACKKAEPPLQYFQYTLHPWVAYVIVPIFALANAGITLGNIVIAEVFHPVVLGIFSGLIVGKQVGIFGTAWLMVKFNLASIPVGVTWWQIYGVAWLGGIGFTMSIFITTLAFDSSELLVLSKLAILASSLLAGVIGYLILRWSCRKSAPK